MARLWGGGNLQRNRGVRERVCEGVWHVKGIGNCGEEKLKWSGVNADKMVRRKLTGRRQTRGG